MELLQLRYFYESARNESFAKTAEKHMVPATSVSASVKRLEKELGCELFHRSSNRITLNENGKKFKQSLSIVFDELDHTINSLTSVYEDSREIKMLVRAMRGEITNHIVEYKTKHPHIAFKTVFDFDETSYDDYDIIIDEKTEKYIGYENIELYTTKIRLTASSQSPLCGKRLSLKQLSNQPFISIGENNSMHNILFDACKEAGFSPNIVVQSNDLLCHRKFVAGGICIGLAREYPSKVTSGDIEYLNITDFNKEQIICCYYKKDSYYGNIKHFLNYLKSKDI